MRGRAGFGLVLSVSLVAAGCTAPVGVHRVSPLTAQRQLNDTALTAAKASDASQLVLRRYNLVELFDDDPNIALSKLRGTVISGRGGGDELFALSELSYLHASEVGSRPHALAAALYAYAFLFPDDPAERPQAIDPRYRWACDLYAAGLTDALRTSDGRTLELRSGTYALPFGALGVEFDPAELLWSDRRFDEFVPVIDYEVEGLRNRYRQPGIGVPVAAKTAAIGVDVRTDDFVATRVRVPGTVLLRLPNPRAQIVTADLHGRLDLFTASEHEEVDINGTEVPLAIDRTAAIAITLTDTAFWKREMASFLGSAIGVHQQARLVATEPYRPGRIPVVFVHGTNSSPGRWADMENDLQNDPRIRERFQFWFFMYDSGNPIAYSALLLRRALKEAEARFDPGGRDACLQQMVVIGHSQGGLLTKMMVIDSGSAIWDNISKMPFDSVRLSDQSRALLQEGLFIKPLPFVTRVVFISTPHRGSYLAGPQIVRRLAAKLISMPRDLVGLSTDVVGLRDPSGRMATLERLPTSLDNMSPGNPFIKTLAGIPIAPGVAAHSIIPVEGAGPPPDDQVDGVVAYGSAHIEGVESERIIYNSTHSTQSNPETVDEVRRILLEQAEAHPCAQAPPRDTSAQQPSSPKEK